MDRIWDIIITYDAPAILLVLPVILWYRRRELAYQKWGGWNPRRCPECHCRKCIYIGDGTHNNRLYEVWQCPKCNKTHKYYSKL